MQNRAEISDSSETGNQRTELEVGYGEEDITPPPGMDLAGYGFYLDRRAESVLDRLRAKALLLRQGADQLVIISCDLIGVSVEYADAVRRKIASSLNLATRQVLLACTHTHSGPATKSALGLGEMNPAYMNRLQDSIAGAVMQAFDNAAPAQFSFGQSVVEPLGYNRRAGGFRPIDPILKVAVFRRSSNSIFVVSYACHPVTLGPTKQISADWPGALAGAIEKDGHHCVFLQGCCGDIDPVTNFNQWASGGPDDLTHFGNLLAHWVRHASKRAVARRDPTLCSGEIHVDIPLSLWSPKEIERKAERFAQDYGHFPGAIRFAREWKKAALQRRPELAQHPFVNAVPLQLLRIGELRILSLPGEVFCEIGLKLQSKWSNTWVIGYGNGTIGYIPTRSSYRQPNDYACYCAPRFQAVFPFSADIERIFLRNSNRLLRASQKGPTS